MGAPNEIAGSKWRTKDDERQGDGQDQGLADEAAHFLSGFANHLICNSGSIRCDRCTLHVQPIHRRLPLGADGV